ncbi:hypothetical protein DAT35_56740 [Vitiosangium sp. GDMCC 1.1324]|nr:hypothetical protein DAT35_56740 [Vitiosangium sp. GDMCC 1.1324]
MLQALQQRNAPTDRDPAPQPEVVHQQERGEPLHEPELRTLHLLPALAHVDVAAAMGSASSERETAGASGKSMRSQSTSGQGNLRHLDALL